MKKLLMIIVGLMFIFVIGGCSAETVKEDSNEQKAEDLKIETEKPEEEEGEENDYESRPIFVVPDPEEVFPDAHVAILRNDEVVYFQLKEYEDGAYDEYKQICKDAGFDDVQYQGGSETTEMYWAYDRDHEYYLELGINEENNIIDIICTKVEEDKEDNNDE